MASAQEWLDKEYPLNRRNEIKELHIDGKNLEGELDLKGFTNLEVLDCNNNKLTNLNFLTGLNSEKLKKIMISNNNLSASDLTPFSRFINLKTLTLGNWGSQDFYNHFHGSLKPLQNLTKLNALEIISTDIDSGLEYLPASLEWLECIVNEILPEGKVKKIKQSLEKFGEPSRVRHMFNYAPLLPVWKENNVELLGKAQKEMLKEEGLGDKEVEKLIKVGHDVKTW